MKKNPSTPKFSSILIGTCLTLLVWGCEKDVETQEEEHFTSLPDFIAETEVNDTGQTVLLFTASDSASLRKDRSPHRIQGFLPQYQIPANTTCALFTAPYQTFPDTVSDKTFRFYGSAEMKNGIFSLSPDFDRGDYWVKAVINTGDSLHISNAARLNLSRKQTDFLTEEDITREVDISERTVLDASNYNHERAVLSVMHGRNHLLSMLTLQRRFILFSAADFEYNSNPEITNPELDPGVYTLDLFLLDKDYRAKGRFITEYIVEE